MIDVDDEPESWTIRELKDRFRSNSLKRDSTFESFNNNNYDFDCKNSADLVPNKLVVNFLSWFLFDEKRELLVYFSI